MDQAMRTHAWRLCSKDHQKDLLPLLHEFRLESGSEYDLETWKKEKEKP